MLGLSGDLGKYLALFWPVTLTWLRYNFYGVEESEEEEDDMVGADPVEAEEEPAEEPAEPVEPVAAEEEVPEEEAPAEEAADDYDAEVDDY